MTKCCVACQESEHRDDCVCHQRMTIKERTEKIAEMMTQNLHPKDRLILIASQIDEAVREAKEEEKERKVLNAALEIDLAYTKGFAAAREKAAQIIETYREEQVGSIKTYYAEDRVLAECIRTIQPNQPHGS